MKGRKIGAWISLCTFLIFVFMLPVINACAAEVVLAWDKLDSSENVVKYRVYIYKGAADLSPLDPFSDPKNLSFFREYFLEDLEDPSEFGLDNSVAIASLSLEDLMKDELYYFAVSAINDANAESLLSEAIDFKNQGGEEESSIPQTGNESSSANAGVAGGCFIQTLFNF